jgi:predicted kinase
MKKFIKETLRVRTGENSLGLKVTKPNQELIIMRGIPGSGKSTKAKSLVGEGIIHSTDDVITSQGDYNDFFNSMVESKDFTPLNRAHSTNLKNAIRSMVSGITPVIIDNTNIKANESKAYVVKALELGLSNDMISIVDVGTGGVSAEVLYKRNTHGVPLEKIESMIQAYESVGGLTLKKILEAKDMYKQSNVLYSAIMLTPATSSSLLFNVGDNIPLDWILYGHHMTICLGPLKNKSDLGNEVRLKVTHLGVSDMAIAVKVNGYESVNVIPHITVAINPDGGKPVMSNNITNWVNVKPFDVEGVVTEVKRG